MRVVSLLHRGLVGALLLLATMPGPAGAASATGWQWPLAGVPTVLRPFQPPPTPYAAGHRGVDLAAPTGAAVLSAGAGVVGFAGVLAGRGVVTVIHGSLKTTYEPVSAVVRAGQAITAGEPIGRLQPPTGHCGAGRSCLHWGLLRGTVYLDPLALLGLTHSVLLPVWGPHLPYAVGATGMQTPRALSAVPASSMGTDPSRGSSGGGDSPRPRGPLPPVRGAALLAGTGLLLYAGRGTFGRRGHG